ncbi:tetratricopeptide repeat protein [Microcoleus sp. B3-D7]|uniref:tetratricopeptide repeat protein n=1 Tax=Microcoleus sp. B3-D7 TaxID=2818659 RepID=UPI002FD43167
MKNTFISRFTPSLMAPETLEAILVKRHTLAERLVELIRVSALTDNKHFQLLIGPRGIGKTHLVSLIYHRVAKMEDLQEKLLIAWLREEEWGIASFLDLLRGIFRAIAKEYPEVYEAQLHDEVEKLYDLSLEQAEFTAAELLKNFVGKRVLLLIVENLEDVFSGLADFGQKQLRAYIQNYSFLTILATSQSLFDGVKLYDHPFYGSFNPHILNEFNVDDAVDLLNHIAKLEGNSDLASFIQTPKGRDRIKVVHYLSGGSPRVYIVFSAFLMTPESLDKLVEPFMAMLDDLTPYYQDRMKYISPQQRKIVDFLCDRGGAAPVKEIAKRCFIEQRTVSSQLKDLRDKGYVTTEEIGRESWYELREPLMRFCLEVKKQRNEPIRLIVDFIRVWYTRQELQQRLGLRMADVDLAEKESHFMYRQGLQPIPPDAVMEREYYTRALEAIERNEEDPRLKAYFDEIENCHEQKDDASALEYAEKLVTSRGEAKDWVEKGRCLNRLKRHEKALECLDKAIEKDSYDARAWRIRGDVLDGLERYEEALVSYDRALELDPNDKWDWVRRGDVLNSLKRYEEALASFDRALELDTNDQLVWFLRGLLLDDLERYEEALASFDGALELDTNDQSAWRWRGNVLKNLKRYEEALVSYDRALELDANDQWAWVNRGNVLKNLKRYEEALESYDRAIKLDANYQWAWHMRGDVLNNLERYEEALESFDRAIKLDANYQWAWANRGNVLNNLERYEEALESYDRVSELNANDSPVWVLRGNVLNNLERYEEALESYDRALELDANDSPVWVLRGNVLKNLKRYEEALESYDRALELDANDQWAWGVRGIVLNNLKRYEEALESYDRALELDANDQWAWGVRGIVLNNLKRYDEGLVSFDRAIELDAHYHLVWFLRGLLLDTLKRYEEALVSYDRAIELDINYQWAWVKRGNVLKNLKRYEEALVSYDRAIELDDNDPWDWASRGDVLDNLKRYEEALESYDRAIELDINYQWAWANRGNILNNLKRYEEALASFDRAIELDAHDPWDWNQRGDVLYNLKRYDEALASYDRASELGYQDSSVFFNRAITILGLNRWDEGIATLDDAFQRLEPGDEAEADGAKLIIKNLFAIAHARTITQTRITSLIAVYEKHEYLSVLGQGIVRNIPALMSEMVSDKAARTWLELWQELTSKYEEFQIPIRLLNAAVRYKETKGDRRVLLELPIEERNLLEPLVSTKPE